MKIKAIDAGEDYVCPYAPWCRNNGPTCMHLGSEEVECKEFEYK